MRVDWYRERPENRCFLAWAHSCMAGAAPSAPGSPDPASPALPRWRWSRHARQPAESIALRTHHSTACQRTRKSPALLWRRRKVAGDDDLSRRVSSCRVGILQVCVVLVHCLNDAFVRSCPVDLSQQYRSCCDSASAACVDWWSCGRTVKICIARLAGDVAVRFGIVLPEAQPRS